MKTNIHLPVNNFLRYLLPSLLVAMAGCSNTSQPNYAGLGLVEISGTIRLDGNPIANAEIRFETVEDGTYSYGHSDDSGHYKLMFDSRKSGIIPGKKRVMILSKRKSESQSIKLEVDEGQDPEMVPENNLDVGTVPACYGLQSTIEVEIKSSESSLDFDLKSDCSTTGRI